MRPTIRGAPVPPRWSGRCLRRRRSTSSKRCRACSNEEGRASGSGAAPIARKRAQALSLVDNSIIDVAPHVSEAGVGDYIALLKPRVMSLVIFTALVGLMIAPVHVHPVLAITSLICI